MLHEQKFLFHTDAQPTGSKPLYNKNGDYSTWFNSLSLKNYLQYTIITSFGLKIEFEGEGIIEVLKNGRIHKEYSLFDNGHFFEIIQKLNNDSVLSLNIPKDSKVIIKSASWVLESQDQESEISCAIVICTHNRHDYVKNTIANLKKDLPKNWSVFVVDNDSKPKLEIECSDTIKYIKNPNTGGSGGFTRGLVEAIKSDKDYSHVLFMDDDIQIDARVLERTNLYLSILKDEYKEWFLSGGMLSLEEPTLLHELTARWNGIRVKHNNHNLDLSNFNNILKTQKKLKHKNQYGAWWFCVIPLTESVKKDLPMPFFVNGDDIEFSLRHSPGILTLNGISVWHEPFHLKYNAIKQHYLTVRNGLFINLKHNYPIISSLFMASLRYLLQRLKGNKKEADIVLYGINHFLLGPEILLEINNPFQIDINEIPTSTFLGLTKSLLKIIFSYNKMKKTKSTFILSDSLWHGINNNV